MSNSVETLKTQFADLQGEERIDCLNDSAERLISRDNAAAFKFAQAAFELASSLEDCARLANSLLQIGRAKHLLTEYEAAEKSFHQAVQYFETLNDNIGRAKCLLGLGNTYFQQNQSLKAFEFYFEALTLSQKFAHRQTESLCLLGIGVFYSSLGDYTSALEYFFQALDLTEADHNLFETGLILNNIGDTLQKLEWFEESLEYFERAEKVAQQTDRVQLQLIASINIGEIHLQLEQPQKAFALFEQSLKLACQLSDRQQQVRAFKNLGRYYAVCQNKELAQQNFEQALTLSQAIKNQFEETQVLTSFGENLCQVGEAIRACELLKRALVMSEEVNLPAETAHAHELLAAAHKSERNFRQALMHFEKYHELKQRLHGERQLKQIEILLARQEIEKTKEVAEAQRQLNEQLIGANQKLERINSQLIEANRRNQDLLEQINYQATHDVLTNLPNRYLFEDRLQQAILIANRYEQLFAVMFLDLDGFKKVNDTMGHDAGDELLIKVAERFQNCLRQSNTIARFGGDEFTIIVNNLKKASDAAVVAHKLINSLRDSFDINGHKVSVGVSIGISIYPIDAQDAVALKQNADAAMYKVKRDGKNNAEFFASAHLYSVIQSNLPNNLT